MPDDLCAPAVVASRTELYATFLSDGLFDVGELLEMREWLNAIFTDGRAQHPRWIKKPQQVADDATEHYLLKVAQRLSEPLARLPVLDYEHATDEDDVYLLKLSCVQAGYRPRATEDELYSFFESSARAPILRHMDLPAVKSERPLRVAGEPLPEFPKSWLREGPYREQLRGEADKGHEDLLARVKELPDAERLTMLRALGGSPVQVEPAPPSPAAATMDVAIGAGIAEGLKPVMALLQDSLLTIGSAVSKRLRKKDDSDSDSEVEDADADTFLNKELRMGGAGLAKKAKTFETLRMDSQCERIRDSQRIRKLKGRLDRFGLEYNQAVDDQTRLEVQLEKLEHLKERPGVSTQLLAKCKMTEQFNLTRISALKEKQRVLEACNDAVARGQLDQADTMLKLYSQELNDQTESKLVRQLKEKAKTQVKADKELTLLEAVARLAGSSRQGGGANHSDSGHQPRQVQQPQPQPSGGHQATPKSASGGAKPQSSQDYQLRWVDGGVYDASLAGMKCPDPEMFPKFARLRLDAANEGVIHAPGGGWKGKCGACGKVGHVHSECPANQWEAGGVKYCNVRWLHSKGMCDAGGVPGQ